MKLIFESKISLVCKKIDGGHHSSLRRYLLVRCGSITILETDYPRVEDNWPMVCFW